MSPETNRIRMLALQYAPLLMFLVLLAIFGSLSDRFLTPNNFINIVTQAAHIAIIAIGMTFVLLAAGIDLSVGASMYASCIVVALYLKGWNQSFGFLVAGSLGLALGAVNVFVIIRLRVPALIATLATLFIGRAIALYFSGVKMIPFGKELTRLGHADMLGIPVAIWIFLLVFLLAWVTLQPTIAVLVDSIRAGILDRPEIRKIRVEET